MLFLQFNYARHRVRRAAGGDRPSRADRGAGPRHPAAGIAPPSGYREQIAETNLALVLAMAKRTRMSEVDFADLVSEGNMALLRAVDKFDCGRGFKFSTYACRAILKAFSRQGMKLSKYRQRFPTDFDPELEKSNYLETSARRTRREAADEVKHIVHDQRGRPDRCRADGDPSPLRPRRQARTRQPMTLEQVGQIIGVTKERVRQIQNKALEKIRLALEESRKEAGEIAGTDR